MLLNKDSLDNILSRPTSHKKGVLFLLSIDILLSNIHAVSILVNITNDHPYTILLRQGRYSVDAKSLLGILSLDLSRNITLEAYSDHTEALRAGISEFIL